MGTGFAFMGRQKEIIVGGRSCHKGTVPMCPKPDFKCWIYASKETAERDINRAEALMRELGITNYEVVRNLPKKHFTDSELRLWAQKEKSKGTPYSHLFDVMAPNHMDCADVHRQWHIVKAVYGRR